MYEHPSVAEVCVIGIPDEYRGQSPKAFVKLKEGASELTLDALKAFLKDRLGKHEMIGALEIRPELPKTAVGKLEEGPRGRGSPQAGLELYCFGACPNALASSS